MFYGIAYSMYNVTRWGHATVVKAFHRITESGNHKRVTEEGKGRIRETE
jgi:hypothetical protein